MRKNTASQIVGAQLVSATDGSAFTGSVTVAVTGDGGTQTTGSVGSGACTHEGNGFHTYAPAQAETNYDHVAFTFTGTGAVPVTVQIYTSFPQTGDSFARIGAPVGASISADIAVIEAQTDDIGAAGAGLTAIPWNAAWDAEVQSEVADALTAYDPPTNAELAAEIDAVQADIAALNDFDPTSDTVILAAQTHTGAVIPTVSAVTGAVGSVTGNVGGNVVGSVASVTGAVGSVTAPVDLAAGAVDDAAVNITENLPANVKQINGTTLTGTGTTGSEWGPA